MQGIEWVIEAWGCSAASLRNRQVLRQLFDSIIASLNLRPIGTPVWHQFPGSGGVTGLCLLSESHLACHTFPEYGSLCLNLFCCVPRSEWEFEKELKSRFAAKEVAIRRLPRPYEIPGAQAIASR